MMPRYCRMSRVTERGARDGRRRRSPSRPTVRGSSLPWGVASLVILVLLLAGPVRQSGAGEYSEYQRAFDVARELGGELLWDPQTELGEIRRGDRSVRFMVGSKTLAIDRRELRQAGEVRYSDGHVKLSPEAASLIASTLRPEIPRDDRAYVSTIFIDPGHGGRDPGTVGRHGSGDGAFELREKDIVLDVSLRLRDLLEQRLPERDIVLSREDDEFLSLDERTDIANQIPEEEEEIVLFVSVHANASFNTRARGFEAWYLPPDVRRQVIAPEELDESRRSIHAILNTMKEEELTLQSYHLADRLVAGLDRAVGQYTENRGVRERNFAVVRNANMPSVLVELGFVTNEAEARLLRREDYLNKLAEGLYSGIRQFVEEFESTS